ncbi:hypothetical protein SDC9_124096 [bioreactor metagenome]|uniref:Thioredoxin domain-containing protein n=1 Tax=bioreactor metagenome TaxID=1076179 RepID=A0A645CJH0_9ZZZZ|nr:thioredoxin family protein [Proteiniphilum sp.]MEA4916932.1 thioredoxin family protein [Proteiniphilum sp.]
MANFEKITVWHILIALVLFTFIVLIVDHDRALRSVSSNEIDDCLIELDSENFSNNMSSSPLSFVLFYVDDFTWCDVMMANLSHLAKDEDYGAGYYKVNLDKYPEFDLKYNISGTPNILIFSSGIEIKRIMGVVSASNLKKIYYKVNKD